MLVSVAAILGASGSGCVSRPELASLREGMNQATATIRKQHLEWAKLLSEGKQSRLPSLSPADYRAVLTAHKEYQDLVDSSRSQDGASGVTPGVAGASTRP